MVASLCSLIWLLIVWNINLTPNSYPLKLVLCLGMLAILPIVYWFAKYEKQIPKRIGNTLALFGKYSLEIYIFHRFMTSTCNLESVGNYILSTKSWTIELVLVMIVALAMACASVCLAKCLSINKILALLLFGKYENLK